jgi:hypothetical protein
MTLMLVSSPPNESHLSPRPCLFRSRVPRWLRRCSTCHRAFDPSHQAGELYWRVRTTGGLVCRFFPMIRACGSSASRQSLQVFAGVSHVGILQPVRPSDYVAANARIRLWAQGNCSSLVKSCLEVIKDAVAVGECLSFNHAWALYQAYVSPFVSLRGLMSACRLGSLYCSTRRFDHSCLCSITSEYPRCRWCLRRI